MGSYTCSCRIGFQLNSNGYGCDGKVKNCGQFSLNLFFDPADIDECTEGTDRCDQNCHNNVGSYSCTCNSGYRLNINGYGCDGYI